jgi:hypothetical protein
MLEGYRADIWAYVITTCYKIKKWETYIKSPGIFPKCDVS